MSGLLATTNDVWALFELPAIRRSALALLLASIGLPVVGVLMIGLDVIPVRFAMMHTALLGVALGLLVGLDPILCALVLSAAAAMALAPLAGRPGGLSGPMGLLMTFAIAAALLVLSISGVNATGAFELLWGSILATKPVDVWLLLAITVATLTLFFTRRRSLGLLLFDRETAICAGVGVGLLTTISLGLTAVAVASAMRLTGALLVDAVTLLPAIAARNVARSLTSMVWWAIGVGVVGNGAGFLLALWLDQPPGPVLVITVAVIALASYLPIIPGHRPATKGTLH
ncbi:MAG: metal ABC transporter permease [Ilumatobacteraceae bacterium]